MSLSLTSRCPVCNAKDNLSRCRGCKVVLYCGRDHQESHRNQHKTACNGIKRAQQGLNNQEQKLRASPGDFMTPSGATIFEDHVGHFWGILETRPYMRARYALVEALLKVDTFKAVQSAYDHIMDMLRLCRSDNMGVRDLAPALFLRLGRDQECYDFITWYSTTGNEGNYDWGDMSLGFLDVKGADVFESVHLFTGKYTGLNHTVAITLIKIRLLLDVKSLQSSLAVGVIVPQEVLDNIRSQLVSTIITGNKEIMDSKDHTSLIKKLKDQVTELYYSVKEANSHFWPALLDPGEGLTARPEYFSRGSPEEMQLALQYNYKSWVETPGAIDIIRKMMVRRTAN